jgi:hypothetical protein
MAPDYTFVHPAEVFRKGSCKAAPQGCNRYPLDSTAGTRWVIPWTSSDPGRTGRQFDRYRRSAAPSPAFALEELRAGLITEVQLCDLLSWPRIQVDGLLKSHGVFEEYTLKDFGEERRAFKELGI